MHCYLLYFSLFYLCSHIIYGFYLPLSRNHESTIEKRIVVSRFDVKPTSGDGDGRAKFLRRVVPHFEIPSKTLTTTPKPTGTLHPGVEFDLETIDELIKYNIVPNKSVTEILKNPESSTVKVASTLPQKFNTQPLDELNQYNLDLKESDTEIFENCTKTSTVASVKVASTLPQKLNTEILKNSTESSTVIQHNMDPNESVTEIPKDSTQSSTISLIEASTNSFKNTFQFIKKAWVDLTRHNSDFTENTIKMIENSTKESATIPLVEVPPISPQNSLEGSVNTLNETVSEIATDFHSIFADQIEQIKPLLYQPEVKITKGKWPVAPAPNPNLPFPDHVQALAYKLNFSSLPDLNHSYNYMDNYGYLSYVKERVKDRTRREVMDPEEGHQHSGFDIADLFTESIRLYQGFVGLFSTGKLDRATVNKMKEARCGNRDLGMEVTHQRALYGPDGTMPRKLKRNKRYAIEGSRWKKGKTVTYCLSEYPKRAVKQGVTHLIRAEIVRAMDTWTKQLPFALKEINCFDRSTGHQNRWADIDLRFAFGAHGDGDDFDGPGGVLAHAYFPEFGGDVHFDESEHWTNSAQGSNLFIVALHETGHALGLDHSADPHSIMQPIYPPYEPGITLGRDDIEGVRSIYNY